LLIYCCPIAILLFFIANLFFSTSILNYLKYFGIKIVKQAYKLIVYESAYFLGGGIIITNLDIYEDIAKRTKGEIYLGVVGPVRTGKSTFIRKVF